MKSFTLLTLSASLSSAFPFMGDPQLRNPQLSSPPVERRQSNSQCPTRSDHTGAVPYNPKYPYLGGNPSKNVNGTGKGGILVPAPGDVDHEFRAPGPNDIRGPCPGLNTAANHGFLSRDGIVTYNELVAAQQNVYNVGYDLANLLATAGVGLDGDVVTEKLSIGCDATARTATVGAPAQKEPGLDGHNKFEGDTSLTRNDYFLANGDNWAFNGTLFRMMSESTGNDFTLNPLSKYRAERWDQSRADNGNFFFGPGSLLLYGAASFLYELFPGSNFAADLPTMKSFFGAEDDGNGGYNHIPERIPSGWRNRVSPYDNGGVGGQIRDMYSANPKPFGAATGGGGYLFFNGDGSPSFDISDSDNVVCALYQLSVGGIPATVGGGVLNSAQVVAWAAGKMNPIIKGNYPCPLILV